MKEITYKGYVRNFGVRAVSDDCNRVRSFYDELRNGSDDIFTPLLCEVTVRVIDPRQKWIDDHYNAAMSGLGFSHEFHFCKDVTILTSYSYPAQVATAAPRHGDKYNRETGIAVAYAKWQGETIPDYI